MCLVLAAGCRTKDSFGGEGDDIVDPTILGGDGAYPLAERMEDGTRVTDVQFESVLFAYDSFQIAPSEIGKIEQVAAYMGRNPGVRLVLEGHCDERGSREYNMSLGEYRALAVRAHLIRLDVDGAGIQTRSYGEEMPADPGHTEAAWRRNRRVEFALFR
jgi:peptidoglycan-associated lipoprotein